MEYSVAGGRIALRLVKGEEVVSSIKALCAELGIKAGSVSGIGASNNAEIGVLDTANKVYVKQPLKGDMEIASLTGNVSVAEDGGVYLHLHAVFGGLNGVYAGHLDCAYVSATAEIFIDVFNAEINRFKDDETGLNLMRF